MPYPEIKNVKVSDVKLNNFDFNSAFDPNVGSLSQSDQNWINKQFKKSWKSNIKSSGVNSGDSGSFMQGLNSMMGGIGAKGGDMLAGFGDMIDNGKYGSFSEDEKSSQSAIRSALAMIPGYGQLIAAATGAVDAIGTATGLNLSSVNEDTAKRSGVKGTELNKFMNMLPGNSMIWGGLSRLSGSNRTESINVSDDVLGMAGYGATTGDLRAAKDLGNKQLFGWQTADANSFINSQKRNNQILSEINRVNTQRKQSDYYQDLQNQNINRYAGQNYLGMTVGKQGMKLMSVEEARRIVALKKAVDNQDVEKFQNGGTIASVDESIMPTGSLHKERHHLEDNPELGDITKKGIPVITVDKNGELNQVAEVERSEWTISKSLTDQIEALFKEWKENPTDELEIKCGELVVNELTTNTVDPGNQLNLEENGKEQEI